MSLFANPGYRWRETYFVLFRRADRPSVEQLQQALESLGGGYEVTAVHRTEDGNLEAMTVVSPLDFAAMDISYVEGDEVREQVAELKDELEPAACSKQDLEKQRALLECDARFDIYHFQQVVDDAQDDEDEYLDPGSLIELLAGLAALSNGISIDPQSGMLM
jgi:hypothetical protein